MKMNKAVQKVDKSEVMYRKATSNEVESNYVCGSCLYWQEGECELVKGNIEADHWCRLYVTELAKDEVHMQLARIAKKDDEEKDKHYRDRFYGLYSVSKEDGGGNGGGTGAVGGTVFTSADSGIFSPTHGGRGPRRKKKGIDRLVDFVTDNSPERKMKKGVQDLTSFVKQESHSVAGHAFMGPLEDEPDWKKKRRPEHDPNPVDKNPEPSTKDANDLAAIEQNDLTNHLKRKQQEDKSHRKESNDAREPGAGVPDLALDWGMGDDELVRGGKKDKIEDLSYIEKKKLKR